MASICIPKDATCTFITSITAHQPPHISNSGMLDACNWNMHVASMQGRLVDAAGKHSLSIFFRHADCSINTRQEGARRTHKSHVLPQVLLTRVLLAACLNCTLESQPVQPVLGGKVLQARC